MRNQSVESIIDYTDIKMKIKKYYKQFHGTKFNNLN